MLAGACQMYFTLKIGQAPTPALSATTPE